MKHRLQRIAFCTNFGGAGLGRTKEGLRDSKAEPWRRKTVHFIEKGLNNKGWAEACLDRAGMSG